MPSGSSANSGPAGTMSIFDHDNAFWLGDLNYRLSLQDLDVIFDRIDQGDFTYLLSHDQLINEKAAGNAFKEWSEGPIRFAPTYKYQPGATVYERRPDKKKRAPAWCDRIQWIGKDIKQLTYRRAELIISDHKPVSSLFAVKIRVVQPDLKKKVYDSLIRQLDVWENAVVPRIELTPSKSLDFGDVMFDTPVTQKLKLTNTGQVVAQFHFASKGVMLSGAGGGGGGGGGAGDAGNLSKEWLSMWPQYGLVAPKQSSMLIRIPMHYSYYLMPTFTLLLCFIFCLHLLLVLFCLFTATYLNTPFSFIYLSLFLSLFFFQLTSL